MATSHPLKRSHSRSSEPASPASKRSRLDPERTVPVRFLILSDTHDAKVTRNLPQCDVVLHCGDLTEDGSPGSILEALHELSQIDAELKLFIAGNHEISLDREYWLAEGGSEEEHSEARNIISGFESSGSGMVFLEEGTHKFELKSGAVFKIYASPWTPRYGASAFQYPSGEDRFNPPVSTPPWAKNVATETTVVPTDVDIVMTHGPPKYILDATSDGRSAGCEHLRRAIARTQPRLHCFGHVHCGYGTQRIQYDDMKAYGAAEEADCIVPLAKEWVGKNQAKRKGHASLPPNSVEEYRKGGQTLMVNAALMNEDGDLGNAPWLVELELGMNRDRDM